MEKIATKIVHKVTGAAEEFLTMPFWFFVIVIATPIVAAVDLYGVAAEDDWDIAKYYGNLSENDRDVRVNLAAFWTLLGTVSLIRYLTDPKHSKV